MYRIGIGVTSTALLDETSSETHSTRLFDTAAPSEKIDSGLHARRLASIAQDLREEKTSRAFAERDYGSARAFGTWPWRGTDRTSGRSRIEERTTQ